MPGRTRWSPLGCCRLRSKCPPRRSRPRRRRLQPMPTVTALRPARPGRVLVELDGEPWRTVSLEVAARSGLELGLELDRTHLRTLRRELRRGEALDAGAKALARRERSERELRNVL